MWGGGGGAAASHVTRGKGGAESRPLGTPLQLLPALPHPPSPRSLPCHLGGWCQKRRWTSGTEHPGQNRQGHVPPPRSTTRGFRKAARRPRVLRE